MATNDPIRNLGDAIAPLLEAGETAKAQWLILHDLTQQAEIADLRVELMAARLGFAPKSAIHVGGPFVTGHVMTLDKAGATFDLAYVGDLGEKERQP